MARQVSPDDPVLLGGGLRPNARFEELCQLAGIQAKLNIESGTERALGTQGSQENLCDRLR
jgi:hypothetical protein